MIVEDPKDPETLQGIDLDTGERIWTRRPACAPPPHPPSERVLALRDVVVSIQPCAPDTATGESAESPVVWTMLALDARTGKERWRKERKVRRFSRGYAGQYASTDGKAVALTWPKGPGRRSFENNSLIVRQDGTVLAENPPGFGSGSQVTDLPVSWSEFSAKGYQKGSRHGGSWFPFDGERRTATRTRLPESCGPRSFNQLPLEHAWVERCGSRVSATSWGDNSATKVIDGKEIETSRTHEGPPASGPLIPAPGSVVFAPHAREVAGLV